MNLWIGVDPGLSGAVAAIDDKGRLISVQDTPTLTVKKGKGTKHVYLDSQMAAYLSALAVVAGDAEDCTVALENVHALPGQGVTSMFSMGVGVGLWRGIIAALRIPVEYIEPTVWKKAMGIPSGSDKSASIVRALQLFPRADLARKKDHNRADAILIAEYCRRKRKGERS